MVQKFKNDKSVQLQIGIYFSPPITYLDLNKNQYNNLSKSAIWAKENSHSFMCW